MSEAEQHRAKAAEHIAKAEESWQRSDTDGFLTQWAHGISSQLEMRKADIAERGGKADFLVAFDADGNLVPMKSIDTKYGTRRVTLNEDGRFEKFYSHASGPRSNFTKDGLTEGWVEHPAVAITAGNGRGLSGNVWISTKPICGECGAFLDAIGRPCREGHVTEAVKIEGPEWTRDEEEGGA